MNAMTTGLGILGIAGLLATGAAAWKLRPKKGSLMTLKETAMAGVLGLMLYGAGIALDFVGPETTNPMFTLAVNLACYGFGSYMILYALVRQTAVSSQGLDFVNVFGQHHFVRWKDIVDVKKPMAQTAFKIEAKDGSKEVISAPRKKLAEFAEIAAAHTQGLKNHALLESVESKMAG